MSQQLWHKGGVWQKFVGTIWSMLAIPVAISMSSLCSAQEKSKPYRLPSVELNQRVIWGSVCEPSAGQGLAFGGEDQQAEDGRPHTLLLRDRKWVEIRSELGQANPWQESVAPLIELDKKCAFIAAQMRSMYFSGEAASKGKESELKLGAEFQAIADKLSNLKQQCSAEVHEVKPQSYEAAQGTHALQHLKAAEKSMEQLTGSATGLKDSQHFAAMRELREELQHAVAAINCEPPARALSMLVYHPQMKVYLLFGGDHLDYLTCDTWIFDPAVPQWRQMHPTTAPAPRANHQLAVDEQGRVTLSGGYTYSSNTDYVGGQYRDWNDGTWTYDLASNEWTGSGEKAKPSERTYRTGPFSPDYFWQGDQPDHTAFQKTLNELPPNKWVKIDIPYLPEMNRDWGTAVFDPTHDLILRFSGGHSAHGGTDVLHFHLKTGRWELSNPVEFPLGQLYSNTSYPVGFNFNRRPWVTGHTYKTYAYDVASERMLFVGEQDYTYVYDPARGDWTGERVKKPDGMNYGGCFYDLTLCPTEHGTFCWTKEGNLFRWEKAADDSNWQWKAVPLQGEKLPGTVVDRSGFVYDSQHQRFLCTTKPYQGPFDGLVYAIDVKSGEVSQLDVPNRSAMAEIGFLREGVYVPELDLMVLGVNFPLQAEAPRRTPAFDCSANRWIALELGDDDPCGKEGRNVSLGLIYDAARKLIWAVDTRSHVFVLRLEGNSLERRPIVP